jgi:hypothetical protein
VIVDPESLELLEAGLRKTMLSTSGTELDAALADLGWADMLSDIPEVAIPLVFRLLGETGSHASVLNDVLLETIGGLPGGTPPMPYGGGGWVVWQRENSGDSTLGGLPLRRVPEGELMRMSEARRALGWCSLANRSQRFRRCGTGWPRRWWPSKAPRQRSACPARTMLT